MLFKTILALNLFQDEEMEKPQGFSKPGDTIQISTLKTVKKGETCFKMGMTEEGLWAMLGVGETFFFADTEACCICLDTHCDVELTNCCSKVFHKNCLEGYVNAKWPTKMINFRYLDCPLCHVPLKHPTLDKLLQEHREFEKKIGELRAYQMEKEPLENEKDEYAFFMCEHCDKPFCGGKVDCAEDQDLEKKTMICKDCAWNADAKDHRCFIHGKNFAMFKCDSCCSIASWDCINNHYCERCHKKASSKKEHVCPGPDKCPLGIPHPRNHEAKHGTDYITGFVIGCIKCVDSEAKADHNYSGVGDLIWDQEGPKKPKNNRRKVIKLFEYGAPAAYSLPTDFSPINPKEAIEKLGKKVDMKKFEDMLKKYNVPRYNVLSAMKRSGIKDAETRIREIEPVNMKIWAKKLKEGASKDEVLKEMALWDYDLKRYEEIDPQKRIVSDKNELAKYVKLMKIGVPRGAVMNKMLQDKLNPKQIDEVEAILKARKGERAESNRVNELFKHHKLAKYIKMHKLKMPINAIKGRMRLDGIPENRFAEVKKVVNDAENDKLKLRIERNEGLKNHKLAKYIKMLKLKIPEFAIKGKMRLDGIPENRFAEVKKALNQSLKPKEEKVDASNRKRGQRHRIQKPLAPPQPPRSPMKPQLGLKELFRKRGQNYRIQKQLAPPQPPRSPMKRQIGLKDLYRKRGQHFRIQKQLAPLQPPAGPPRPRRDSVKEQPNISKYQKMIEMGVPENAVRMEMMKNGMDLKWFSHLEKRRISKYEKMLKLMPQEAVKNRMKLEGINYRKIAKLFGENENAPEIALGSKRAPEKKTPPELQKYCKMLKMGVAKQAVRNKMTLEGFDEKRFQEIESGFAKSPLAPRSPNYVAPPSR